MIRDPGRAGCAFESRGRDEPILGTASRVRRWLLIEQPGAWGRDALAESQLPAGVAATIAAQARATGVRVLLVRDRSREGDGPRTALLARSDRVHRWIERIPFEDPKELVDLDLSAARSDDPPGLGEALPSSVSLVCTNGKHDPCCADLGRPVLRELRRAGADVWESSHVGGDRFAANMVCLPTGVYYGRVQPEEAARILREHEEGLLDLDRFRGRSCFPPLVQAAELFARRALDERGLHALRLEATEPDGADRAVVQFRRGDEHVHVTVSRRLGPPELLTCADEAHQPWRYALDDLQVDPPRPVR